MNKIILLAALLCSTVLPQQTEYNLISLELQTKQFITSEYENANPLVSLQQPAKKNIGLAILYSFLLPGMGELYAGGYESGKYFTIAEGLLWGSYIGVNTYGGWQKDRYTTYAQSNGKVIPDGKDEDYFAIIGEYSNIEQYNNDQALDRNFDEIYNESTHYWKWDTEQERRSYRSMWVSSEQAFNNLRFIAGLLVVNRIASAINAVRLTAAFNKRQQTEMGWNLSVGTINLPGHPSALAVNFHASF
jgi:hypothetical protein